MLDSDLQLHSMKRFSVLLFLPVSMIGIFSTTKIGATILALVFINNGYSLGANFFCNCPFNF